MRDVGRAWWGHASGGAGVGGASMAWGVHARGSCVVVGVCVQERQPLKRAVRILLECILVII